MTKPADMTAAPVEHEGIKFYPLMMNDWGALGRWMQQDIMDTAIETAKRNQLTGELLTATLSTAQALAGSTSTATEAGFAKLNTFNGFLKLMELSSKGVFNSSVSDDMSEVDLSELVEKMGNAILAISQPESEDGEDGGAEQSKKK